MPMYLTYQTIPVSSLTIIKPEDRGNYLTQVFLLPKKIQDVLFSDDTGAYVRGLGKSYDISEELQPTIAFAILELALGKKTFEKLPENLSTELKLPSDKAQKMTAEIEHDLFAPIKEELDAFLKRGTSKKSPSAPVTAQPPSNTQQPNKQTTAPKPKPAQAQNVLDLKELNAAKKQEQLPQRAPQKKLPPGTTGSTVAPPPQIPHRPQPAKPADQKSQTPPPKFPLPPKTPKPPNSPLRFT